MKCIYVTKNLPFGMSEAFIFPEIEDHIQSGMELFVVPTRLSKLVHLQKESILLRTLARPLIDAVILRAFIEEAIGNRQGMALCWRYLMKTRGINLKIRNAAVLPKAAWLARWCRTNGIEHIHSHWLAVPSTLALFASQLSGTAYSITAHRYDIAQRNLVDEKCQSATFVRAIDEAGLQEIKAELKEGTPLPILLRMGVPTALNMAPPSYGELSPLNVIVGARFVEKKGLSNLIRAVALLRERGRATEVDLYGEGPLEQQLRELVIATGVSDVINFRGPASHDELSHQLTSGRYHVAVLPSVVAKNGDKEGIPVFLMEAMAAGLPVIGTDSGGISELLHDGAGLTVPQGDEVALANALHRIAQDETLRAELTAHGLSRVTQEYSAKTVANRLRHLFAQGTKGHH